MSEADRSPFTVAIVGGGIAGVTLAIGLQTRGVRVKLYEQASSLKEIGAGIAFSPNAVRCMGVLDPKIVDGYKRVATKNEDPAKQTSYFQWVDGYHHDDADSSPSSKWLFEIDEGSQDVGGAHRAHYLEELVKLLPDGVAEFHKHLDNISEPAPGTKGGKVTLKFHDGTTAQADAVIGCDGIKSRTRQILFGEDNPMSYPHYSHKFAFRGLVPMEKAAAQLGAARAGNRHMYMGPDAHVLTFPVNLGKVMNVVMFVHDPLEWPDAKRLTLPARKEEAVEWFKDWGADVRAITQMLEPELDKWAIFDTWDHPLETFYKGRVCLTGDAAHASTPHHGAGAGFGIEDSAVLCSLLDRVNADMSAGGADGGRDGRDGRGVEEMVAAAFAAFDASRRGRAQWLVESSRVVGDTYEWRNPLSCRNVKKCEEEIRSRYLKVWRNDEQVMIRDALEDYKQRLRG